ncbi:MAG: SUMF1/EgtB/PvdO family nonheme iron enzyme [Kofleriaceae bacterium]|nr:SUMF1/EgtB/PvdO family nonheme iron enzyme [Kofleriaceae bacterium]
MSTGHAVRLQVAALVGLGFSCGQKVSVSPLTVSAPLSRLADSRMLVISSGTYVSGSTAEEREEAYQSYFETYGRDSARQAKWFQFEAPASEQHLDAYRFDKYPVTQAEFEEFVRATRRAVPAIGAEAWKQQRFSQDYAREVRRFNWENSLPPRERAEHPVVLVTWKDASEYCKWRGSLFGKIRILPNVAEFEKAARGRRGAAYPWGRDYQPDKLNSAERGPRDTQAVGSYPEGMSARGAMDVAGNVFQWTRTPWQRGKGRMTVKGSAWDDHGGLGRAAAAHGRRASVRHVIVGFRCSGPL